MPQRLHDFREVAAELRGRLGAISLATAVLEKSDADALEMINLIHRNADEIIELANQLDNLRIADEVSRCD